jgi:transcription-repair coupling factor (superfamily II helicase)
VGRLRAECARTGVREITVARDTARISPLELKTSQRIRLQRLYGKAVYKEDLAQLVVPVPRGANAVDFLLEFFAAMVPNEDPSVASAAP